jgi:hypothetical protein
MAGGKGDGAGSGYGDLNSKITCLKGTLFCFNVATWVNTERSLNFYKYARYHNAS